VLKRNNLFINFYDYASIYSYYSNYSLGTLISIIIYNWWFYPYTFSNCNCNNSYKNY